MIQILIPEKVNTILEKIKHAGYEAYVVGGCVRDTILGRQPEDWDITTSANPMQIKELFPRTVDTGIQHGTVTVLLEKEGFEVTTYRIDGEYEDSRHPKEVLFTPNLEDDLKRRDFTINAMAYNDEDGLIDLFDGIGDLQRGIIRAVGDAEERFGEDALRIMRAVRFSAQLGYTIEEKTMTAISKLAANLKNISAERIQVELTKLLTSPNPDYLRVAYEAGITAVILPEFDAAMATEQNNVHHCYRVGEHILQAMKAIEPDKVLRLTMLFHDLGKARVVSKDEKGIYHFNGHSKCSRDMAENILKRLRYDNDTISKVTRLVLYHDYGNSVMPTPAIVRKAVHEIGPDIFPYLFPVKIADTKAKSDYQRKEKEECIKEWQKVYQNTICNGDCVSLKSLAVNGKDLLEYGVKPGKEIGETLERMLQDVLEYPEHNTREYLLTLLS